jgi:hypothetical protein
VLYAGAWYLAVNATPPPELRDYLVRAFEAIVQGTAADQALHVRRRGRPWASLAAGVRVERSVAPRAALGEDQGDDTAAFVQAMRTKG